MVRQDLDALLANPLDLGDENSRSTRDYQMESHGIADGDYECYVGYQIVSLDGCNCAPCSNSSARINAMLLLESLLRGKITFGISPHYLIPSRYTCH